MGILDLSETEIDQETASVFKKMGARLYVDYHADKVYVNKNYWNRLPSVAKDAMIVIFEMTRKELA